VNPMHRYIILILLVLMLSQVLAAVNVAAKIGEREYSEKELADGFAAYLEYQHIPYTLNPADSLKLYEQFFDELVAMYIYDHAIEDGGVKIRANDLEVYIEKNPPVGVQSIPELKTDGKFDIKKYHKALMERPSFRQEVLDYSRDVFTYHVLLDGIRSRAKVDEDSLRTAWLRSGTTADASIIYFDYSRYRELKADDAAVRALYDEIKDREYKKTNGRNLRFVRFGAATSRATGSPEALAKAGKDSKALAERARQIGLRAAAAEMGFELLESKMFSPTDPFIRGIGREGELIRMTFAASPGTIFDPYTGMMGDILVCEVAGIADSYYEDYDSIQSILQLRADTLLRAERNREYVAEFIRKHKVDDYLAAAIRDSIRIVEQSGIGIKSSYPPIGEVEALNRAIISTPKDAYTPLIEDHGRFFLARVNEVHRRTNTDWEAAKEDIIKSALREAQARYLDEWYLQERAKLDILLPAALRQRN